MNATKAFTDKELRDIESAVADAESRTSGELVCAVATESGRYDRAESIIGLITALVLVVMTALWIGFHAETWRNDWVCSASFTSSVAARRAISIGAAGSLGMLASTTLWLGWRRTGHRIVGSLFWLAVVASWLVCGAMLMTGSIDTCTGTAL